MINIRPTCIAAFATVLLASGCTSDRPAQAAAPIAKPAASIAPHVESAFYETSGPVVVENQVDVLAQRDGVIAEIAVPNDSAVEKDQLLARMDDRQIKADRDAAESKMRAMAADFKNFETEQKLVEIDLARDEEMFASSLITKKQLDHSRTRLVGVKYEVEREQNNLANAESVLKSLNLELEKTRIVAPFSGVVARRYIREGQRVLANDKLFWVTAIRPLRVQFTVPESFAGKLHIGDKVSVRAASSPEMSNARVTLVSPVVDPASGTIDVQAQIESPPASLLPGMSATVRVANKP